ncbi:putative transaldolase 1 [Clostridia bacterium]|nr:putative transaldolase 1 [Clostridia bacterium]
MKFFIDTANVEEIKQAYEMGILSGVTTNPSIIAKEGKEFKAVMKQISGIVGDEVFLFGEVISLNAPEMIKEARELVKLHKKFIVKIPMCVEGLKAVRALKKEGITCCMTLCFSVPQALLAANAGAAYVAPFVGRVDDIGWEGTRLVADIAEIFAVQNIKTELVVASTRNPVHIIEIARAGADIATVPSKVLFGLINHPLTKSGLEQFLKDWESVPKN